MWLFIKNHLYVQLTFQLSIKQFIAFCDLAITNKIRISLLSSNSRKLIRYMSIGKTTKNSEIFVVALSLAPSFLRSYVV